MDRQAFAVFSAAVSRQLMFHSTPSHHDSDATKDAMAKGCLSCFPLRLRVCKLTASLRRLYPKERHGREASGDRGLERSLVLLVQLLGAVFGNIAHRLNVIVDLLLKIRPVNASAHIDHDDISTSTIDKSHIS